MLFHKEEGKEEDVTSLNVYTKMANFDNSIRHNLMYKCLCSNYIQESILRNEEDTYDKECLLFDDCFACGELVLRGNSNSSRIQYNIRANPYASIAMGIA